MNAANISEIQLKVECRGFEVFKMWYCQLIFIWIKKNVITLFYGRLTEQWEFY